MTSHKSFRLSAGAIAFDGGKLLLVRNGGSHHGRDFMVPPGGGVEGIESIPQAAVRETREETGLDVSPGKLLFIEDMISSRKRVVKFWFLCSLIGGELFVPREAANEGIVAADWFSVKDLANQTVYPSILLEANWTEFYDRAWQTKYIENRDPDANF